MISELGDRLEDIILEYPHGVELPLSRGYTSVVDWLESVGITEYEPYSFMRNEKPYITYYFKRSVDAALFALKWS